MTSYDRRNLYKNWGGGIGINKIGSLVYRSEEFVRKVFYKILRESVIKSSFGSCGKNVHIAEKSDIKGIGNISIGDDVAIGPHALLWTTRANIIIKEKVIIGPNLFSYPAKRTVEKAKFHIIHKKKFSSGGTTFF